MNVDVFISYARADRELAAYLARKLEERGVTSWYDARIESGSETSEEGVAALKGAGLIAILFADEANKSGQMRKELALADSLGKPVVPFLVENTQPRGAWLHALADRNWIHAFPEPMLRIDEISGLLARLSGKAPPEPAPASPSETAPETLEEKERKLDAAIGEMIREAVEPAHAPPLDPKGYVGATDGHGNPVHRLSESARLLLTVVTFGAYGVVGRSRAIRNFRANIRKQ